MVKPTIHVAIIDDVKVERCDTHCGVDWSSAEAVVLAQQRIKDRFGNRIRLEYLNLSDPQSNRRILELMPAINGKNFLFPLLLVNGDSRISGRFDIRQMLDVIEVEIELAND